MTVMAKTPTTSLIERLPRLRGRMSPNAPLAGVTWFGVGGPAELLVRPADRDDLVTLLAGKPAEVPLVCLGVASNLLVRDGGIAGLVLRLGRGFAGIHVEDDCLVCGAAALDLNVAKTAQRAGLTGLEFLRGVPGTIGGALRMNAGAYGREIKEVVVEAEFLDPAGGHHRLTAAELGLTYRHSTAATF